MSCKRQTDEIINVGGNEMRLNSALFQSFLLEDTVSGYEKAIEFAKLYNNQLDNSRLYGAHASRQNSSVIEIFATMHSSQQSASRLSHDSIKKLFDIILKTGGAMKLPKENVYRLALKNPDTPISVFGCFFEHPDIFGLEGVLSCVLNFIHFIRQEIYRSTYFFDKCLIYICNDAHAYELLNVTANQNPLFIACRYNKQYEVQKLLALIPLVELDLFYSPNCGKCSICEQQQGQCQFQKWQSVEQYIYGKTNRQICSLVRAGREIVEEDREKRTTYIRSMKFFPVAVCDIIVEFCKRPFPTEFPIAT